MSQMIHITMPPTSLMQEFCDELDNPPQAMTLSTGYEVVYGNNDQIEALWAALRAAREIFLEDGDVEQLPYMTMLVGLYYQQWMAWSLHNTTERALEKEGENVR